MARQNQEILDDSYLENTKASVKLLGLIPLMNPFADKISAQRGAMFSSHAAQAQVISGCEHPKIFTGFESMIGEYEYNTTEREGGIQVLERIPRFVPNVGIYPLKINPYYTIVYRGDDGKVGYFHLEKYTMRSEGYGYTNTWLNTDQLNKGNYIPAEMKLCTSPAHNGNEYMMGTNLKTAYMSLPEVTEDAFVISESAAEKLATEAYIKVAFKILPNQIPLDLYGNEDEYKFMPDIGEYVNSDGIVCALRSPTQDTIIPDMSKENLSKVQYLHDTIFCAPPGAQVVNVDVYVNRKCKVKTPKEIFAQVQKYREHINAYNLRIWDAYQQAMKEDREVSPAFNTLVTRAVSQLIADNVRIPGYTKKSDLTLVKKKEQVEYLYLVLTLRYRANVQRGYKLSGR